LVFTSAYPIVAVTPRLLIAVLRRVFAAAYADAGEMERLSRLPTSTGRSPASTG
jgi:hypothetical protein